MQVLVLNSGSSSLKFPVCDVHGEASDHLAPECRTRIYRVRKYVGAYLAVLGGAEVLVFGGGIGENAPEIRDRICEKMEWCGLRLSSDRNRATVGLAQRSARMNRSWRPMGSRRMRKRGSPGKLFGVCAMNIHRLTALVFS